MTPMVTSSNGRSTVVGASPRAMRRYSPPEPCSMRMALVVVEPQSVATMRRIGSGMGEEIMTRAPSWLLLGRLRAQLRVQQVVNRLPLSVDLLGVRRSRIEPARLDHLVAVLLGQVGFEVRLMERAVEDRHGSRMLGLVDRLVEEPLGAL